MYFKFQIKSVFGAKMFALGVVIKIPVPKQTAKTSFQVTSGRAKYNASIDCLVWKWVFQFVIWSLTFIWHCYHNVVYAFLLNITFYLFISFLFMCSESFLFSCSFHIEVVCTPSNVLYFSVSFFKIISNSVCKRMKYQKPISEPQLMVESLKLCMC